MRQAIVTKFLGPTNHRGARVKAMASAGSVVVSWDYAEGIDANHARAAKALADKFGWGGSWAGGGMPGGNGNAYLDISTDFTPGFDGDPAKV